MIDLIVKLLPEWVLPVLFGALVWFGANFIFIAPELGRRTVENSCPPDRLVLCHCVASHMLANARLDLALWTSTLGFYQVEQAASIVSARKSGIEQCQKQ